MDLQIWAKTIRNLSTDDLQQLLEITTKLANVEVDYATYLALEEQCSIISAAIAERQ